MVSAHDTEVRGAYRFTRGPRVKPAWFHQCSALFDTMFTQGWPNEYRLGLCYGAAATSADGETAELLCPSVCRGRLYG